MTDLRALPNIGEVLKEKLISIGIDSAEKLIESGSAEAYRKLKIAGHDPCCSMLYALEGAVRGIRWHNIPKEELAELKKKVI